MFRSTIPCIGSWLPKHPHCKSPSEVSFQDFHAIKIHIASAFFNNEKGEAITKGLGVSLRELLLQEPIDTQDFEGALAELIGCACDELLFGVSHASRTLTFKIIFNLHHVPQGQVELNRLGRPGGCMHELATRMLNGWENTL
jgi:hypothetical protein